MNVFIQLHLFIFASNDFYNFFLSFTDIQELHWKSNYIFYNTLLLITFIAKAFCIEDSLIL
jgi:hypothetical protein